MLVWLTTSIFFRRKGGDWDSGLANTARGDQEFHHSKMKKYTSSLVGHPIIFLPQPAKNDAVWQPVMACNMGSASIKGAWTLTHVWLIQIQNAVLP